MSATASSTPVKRRRKTKVPKPTRRDSALTKLLATSAGRTLLAVTGRAEVTREDAISPPGSLLEAIVAALRQRTDIPPMLGVASAMAMISAALVQSRSTFRVEGELHEEEMDLWIVCLSPSGAGKTLSSKCISNALELDLATMPDAGSAPAFLDELAKRDGRAYWPRDEYGQLIRAIARNDGPKSDLRDVLLRTYDHTDVTYSTRAKGEIRIPRPALTILGLSVDGTWGDCVNAEMLADGLLARHLFLLCEDRPMSTPRYRQSEIEAAIREVAGDIPARLRTPTNYVITADADEVYHSLWHQLVGDLGGSLDRAYVRRITWAAMRYSVIYHILLGVAGTHVGRDAMRWAWRMVMLHCHSTRLVLAASDRSLAAKVERIHEWISNQRAAGVDVNAQAFSRKVLQRFSRDLASIGEAKQIIDLARA